jgi:hypothetical protein
VGKDAGPRRRSRRSRSRRSRRGREWRSWSLRTSLPRSRRGGDDDGTGGALSAVAAAAAAPGMVVEAGRARGFYSSRVSREDDAKDYLKEAQLGRIVETK